MNAIAINVVKKNIESLLRGLFANTDNSNNILTLIKKESNLLNELNANIDNKDFLIKEIPKMIVSPDTIKNSFLKDNIKNTVVLMNYSIDKNKDESLTISHNGKEIKNNNVILINVLGDNINNMVLEIGFCKVNKNGKVEENIKEINILSKELVGSGRDLLLRKLVKENILFTHILILMNKLDYIMINSLYKEFNSITTKAELQSTVHQIVFGKSRNSDVKIEEIVEEDKKDEEVKTGKGMLGNSEKNNNDITINPKPEETEDPISFSSNNRQNGNGIDPTPIDGIDQEILNQIPSAKMKENIEITEDIINSRIELIDNGFNMFHTDDIYFIKMYSKLKKLNPNKNCILILQKILNFKNVAFCCHYFLINMNSLNTKPNSEEFIEILEYFKQFSNIRSFSDLPYENYKSYVNYMPLINVFNNNFIINKGKGSYNEFVWFMKKGGIKAKTINIFNEYELNISEIEKEITTSMDNKFLTNVKDEFLGGISNPDLMILTVEMDNLKKSLDDEICDENTYFLRSSHELV